MRTHRFSSIFRPALFLLLIFAFSGCASMQQADRMQAFNNSFGQGQYAQAAELELKHSNLLGNLHAAAALRYSHQYDQSNELFDTCELKIKERNEKDFATKVAKNVGSIMINDTVVGYRATEYDGVMVNTYKALNFWKAGKVDLARVEFNRALDRQRRAKKRFAREIRKMKADLAERQASENSSAYAEQRQALDFNRNVNNPEIDRILRKNYSNLDAFEAYPDFTNPFTTYMAGLFFMSQNDYRKASNLLKESYAMSGKNRVVGGDFTRVEGALRGKRSKISSVWVIYENGQGPVKEEFRVDLPLYLVTNQVSYVGIALPKLAIRGRANTHLSVRNSKGKAINTVAMASMDRVAQTEFKKRYPTIVTRSVVSALLKTYGQYKAHEEYGQLGSFAAGLLQKATTSADIRVWSALPKEFQVARVSVPRNGKLSLSTPNGKSIEVIVPSGHSSIVYVKQPTAIAAPVYEVIEM